MMSSMKSATMGGSTFEFFAGAALWEYSST